MKLHLLALTLLLGSAIQNSTTAEGSIAGKVLRAGTGEPLANTPVTLISSSGLSDAALATLLDQISQLVTAGLQGQGGGGNQNQTIQGVTNLLKSAGPGVATQGSMLTDREGRFAFSNLPRGRYTVWVHRFNYFGPLLYGVPTSTISVTVSLDPAKPVPPVDLYLTQGVAITGRVLDPRGQPPPAPAWSITAYRATYSEGKLVWFPVLSRPIDDRGEYRLSPLAPGDYYVGVTPPQTALAPPGQNPPVRTFFPGVTEPAQATKLTLKSSDVPNVDFSVRVAPSAFFKISGVAINPAATANAVGVVDRGFNNFVLMPVESHLIDSLTPGQFVNTAAATSRTTGEFEIRNVRPGTYELLPLPLYSGFSLGRTIVDVRGTDVVGARLTASPIVNVHGRVVVAEQNAQRPLRLDAFRIILKPLQMPPLRSVLPAIAVNSAGDFSVGAPAGAMATLQVSGLPDTAFISDIRMGSSSVFNNGFELSSTSEPITVLINTTSGGTVETVVRTADGRMGPRANVVLVPSEDRRQNPMGFKTGITDTDGRLTLRGVAPGSYTAFAWESVPDTAWLNKDFLAKYQGRGTELTVSAGAQMNLQLNWIPIDADLR